jgi:hypothetical protein
MVALELGSVGNGRIEKSTEGIQSWLVRYEDFLLKNASQMSSIESSLRSLSFILPGRFKDVEVASEACMSNYMKV